ncbi:MAG: hypothetical protein IPK50_05355 [Fibrobacterota bacterium]|nr:hypothetical protein [Fibrobacterota bacterium]QQS06321.1 MAG: hypothetical protein IPK50_05355 [Fibrobacterota bacterium]
MEWIVLLVAGLVSAQDNIAVRVDTLPYWEREDPWLDIEDSEVDSEEVHYRVGDYLIEGTKGLWVEWIPRRDSAKRPGKGELVLEDSAGWLRGTRHAVNGVYRPFRMRSQFAEFPANRMKSGRLAAPDFRTDPAANEYRSRIREGCERNGVNFAGHFTVVEWGCGAGCQMMALVDRIDGRILYRKIPFDTMDGHSGTLYKADSRLMVVNTEALQDHKGWQRIYWRKPAAYVLDKVRFRQVD